MTYPNTEFGQQNVSPNFQLPSFPNFYRSSFPFQIPTSQVQPFTPIATIPVPAGQVPPFPSGCESGQVPGFGSLLPFFPLSYPFPGNDIDLRPRATSPAQIYQLTSSPSQTSLFPLMPFFHQSGQQHQQQPLSGPNLEENTSCKTSDQVCMCCHCTERKCSRATTPPTPTEVQVGVAGDISLFQSGRIAPNRFEQEAEPATVDDTTNPWLDQQSSQNNNWQDFYLKNGTSDRQPIYSVRRGGNHHRNYEYNWRKKNTTRWNGGGSRQRSDARPNNNGGKNDHFGGGGAGGGSDGNSRNNRKRRWEPSPESNNSSNQSSLSGHTEEGEMRDQDSNKLKSARKERKGKKRSGSHHHSQSGEMGLKQKQSSGSGMRSRERSSDEMETDSIIDVGGPSSFKYSKILNASR